MTGGDAAYETAILKKWAGDNVIGVIYGSILTRALTPPEGWPGTARCCSTATTPPGGTCQWCPPNAAAASGRPPR